MASKRFVYFVTLSILLVFSLIFYTTSEITTKWPVSNIQSSSLFSITKSSTTVISSHSLSNQTRRFALFSSSIHSKLRSYIFYAPIAAGAWQRLGYEVIVVFTGDFTDRSNASKSPQLNLSRAFLKRLGVHTIDFQCDMSYSTKMSQLVRLFGGFFSDTIVQDNDYILTTDSDIIPMQSLEYELVEGTHGFIYNAFCCGSFQRRNKTYDMYPMSHICLKKYIWRDMFLESIQRKELLDAKISSLNMTLLSDQAPFSFETVNAYTRYEFGKLYDSNMTKGDAAWYMDQVYSSMLINDYFQNHPNMKIDKRSKTSKRLDPHLPVIMWESQRLPSYGDAHLIHDEVFDSYQFVQFRKLLFFLFNYSLANDFVFYYKQFSLVLNDRPEDH
ncbi:hypothetical protein I4U23_001754 [Adineta vaga]|nr:hypothetical protein I4U23_001754 [Adineta vaga]